MQKEIAEKIAEALENNGVDGVEIHNDYSGRSMYGNTTHAVSFDGRTNELVTAVINHAYLFEDENVNGFRTDSMGLGMVIY